VQVLLLLPEQQIQAVAAGVAQPIVVRVVQADLVLFLYDIKFQQLKN
jgi:hypothetical protein